MTGNKAVLFEGEAGFLLAQRQLDKNWTLVNISLDGAPTVNTWLLEELRSNAKIGANPKLYTHRQWEEMECCMRSKGHELIQVSSDIIDEIWEGKPKKSLNPIVQLEIDLTGQTVKEKLEIIREKMRYQLVDWLILTTLDDIAWLFNVRGSDIEHNPVFFSYAVIHDKEVHVFLDNDIKNLKCHLCQINITFHKYDEAFSWMKSKCNSGKVWLSQSASHAVASSFKKDDVFMTMYSPVTLIKCIKNSVEISGMKRANVVDSVAFCQFLEWMEDEVPKDHVTEYTAGQKLLEFRKQQKDFVSSSFDIHSTSGSNGSFTHFSPDEAENVKVTTTDLYYNDSGAHYKYGTTDTTRTVHFGEPTQYEKECFTAVLKGVIAVSTTVFPEGIKGYMLDTLARRNLWTMGLDYPHSTGHAVGCYLNVTEEPYGLRMHKLVTMPAISEGCGFKPGITITVEPGYYEPNKFGMRIENSLLCIPCEGSFKERFLKFDTMTYVPIQPKLIDMSLLDNIEINWLNNYHKECLHIIGDEMKKQGLHSPFQWLKNNTKPV